MGCEQNVVIDYTNYRGERSLRLIMPLRMEFKSTEWHAEPQWILEAIDLHKKEVRGFAVSEIRTWMPAEKSGIAPTR